MADIIDETLLELDRIQANLNAKASEAKAKEAEGLYQSALEQIRQFERVKEIMQIMQVNRKPESFTVKAQGKKEEGVAIAQLSDVHGGEIVEPETVNFLNEYTPDIAHTRLEKWARGVIKMVNLWREISPIHVLVIADEGDAWSGNIHEELKLTTVHTPNESVLWYRDEFSCALDFLLKHGKFKRIHVIKKFGNHTRRQKEVFHAAAYRTNDEYMLAKLMEADYRKEKKITWQVDTGYFSWFDCFSFPLRFHHGNAVRYNSGIGGKVIPLKRAIAQKWGKAKKAYKDFLGHFHEFEPQWDDYISNGSIIGYSAYSQEKFPYQPPMQAISMIDKRRGLVAALPIFVAEPREVK